MFLKKKSFKILVFLLSFIVFSQVCLAADAGISQDGGAIKTQLQNAGASYNTTDTTGTTLSSIIGTVVNAFLSLLGVIFISLMVYAGYTWMTASGNEDKVQKATDLIKRAITGLIITVGAYAIWNFILMYFILR